MKKIKKKKKKMKKKVIVQKWLVGYVGTGCKVCVGSTPTVGCQSVEVPTC
jgi:hypothetical protein